MGKKRATKAKSSAGGAENAPPEREIAEGELLFDVGDPGTSVFFLRGGEVDLLTPGPEGGFHLFERVTPGGSIGAIDVIAGRQRTCQARAQTPVRVLELDAATFRAMCHERPGIATRILEEQALRTGTLEQRLGAVGADDLVRPIAYTLLVRSQSAERGVRVATTLRELSNDSGLSMRQAHRGLQQLFEAKNVRLHDDALWIPDPDALRAHLRGTPLGEALAR